MIPAVTGWRCDTCGTEVAIGTAWPWRCPAAGESRHHVLRIVRRPGPLQHVDHPNPFVAYDAELAWASFAHAHGMDAAARRALVLELDDAVAAVAGTGFVVTPTTRSDGISDEFAFTGRGGVWVKDETHNVAGSHKARHLFTILLHLVACERLGLRDASARPPLAIASCGNAALAAAMRWPIRVFVPPSANPAVLARLDSLGAAVVTCPRRDGDPPGDPCVHRFREAVAAGAVPFGVQGPENALCLDGGRTIGLEIAAAVPDADCVFVQVGGGALVTGVGDGLRLAAAPARVVAVQTEGCAPLVRAWYLSTAAPDLGWDDVMWPWADEPASAATGILDDETYDWPGARDAMRLSGGSAVTVSEDDVDDAQLLAHEHTTIDADHTGTAGLAGVIALRNTMVHDERVFFVFSGIRRT